MKLSNNIYIYNQSTFDLEQPEISTTDIVGFPSKVILFNDDWHTFDDVINQLIKAINCSKTKAEEIAWEVHSKGKSCVYSGELEECLRISSILEEIALHTQIEC